MRLLPAVALVGCGIIDALNDGVMPYPFMGWNAWALLPDRGQPNETNLRAMADAMVSSGLVAAGYTHFSWGEPGIVRDATTGRLKMEFPEKWPSGVKSFTDYLHANGMKAMFGSSPGATSCTGEVGVCGPRSTAYPTPSSCHADADAEWFASIGSDHWPSDWCQKIGRGNISFAREQYARISAAILRTKRPMALGAWIGGFGRPWLWAPEIAHTWRSGNDMRNEWSANCTLPCGDGVIEQVDNALSIPNLASYTGPGAYNNLDALIVGHAPNDGKGVPGKGLTIDEAHSAMSLWVTLASPLLLTLDITKIKPEILAILTNPEVLAVHKDPLAKMGTRIDTSWSSKDHAQWAATPVGGERLILLERPLANGDTAVTIVNRGSQPTNVSLFFQDLGGGSTMSYRVRDLWRRSDLGVFHCCHTFLGVPPHGVRFLRLAPLPDSTPEHVCDTAFLDAEVVGRLVCPSGWAHLADAASVGTAAAAVTSARPAVAPPAVEPRDAGPALERRSPGVAPPPWNWKRHGRVTSLDATTPPPLRAPNVIDDGSVLRMYYTCAAQPSLPGYHICLATAPLDEPMRWTPSPRNPVLSPSTDPRAFDSEGCDFPNVVRVNATHWRMYYMGWGDWAPSPQMSNRGGLALSADGENWSRALGGEPVLPLGGSGDWDSDFTGSVAVLPPSAEHARWRMWYTAARYRKEAGGALVPYVGIGLATSDDGLEWVRAAANPVLAPRGQFSTNGSAAYEYTVSKPWVVEISGGGAQLWHSYITQSVPLPRGGDYRIGVAVAPTIDGAEGAESEGRPIEGHARDGAGEWRRLPPDEVGMPLSPSGWDSHMLEYACVLTTAAGADGALGRQPGFRMWYSGDAYSGIGYAESS